MRRDIGSIDEFETGRITLRRVGRRELGILLIGDGGVAIRNQCPHAGAPLCRGVVAPLMTGVLDHETVAMRSDETRLVLSCPWHGWEFDVVSGQALADERMRVKTYPLAIENGRVL